MPFVRLCSHICAHVSNSLQKSPYGRSSIWTFAHMLSKAKDT